MKYHESLPLELTAKLSCFIVEVSIWYEVFKREVLVMALIKSIIILIIGFALLMKGADYFVEGSSSVAKQLHVPSMIIGMTIVAM